jgi:hypothetical protein
MRLEVNYQSVFYDKFVKSHLLDPLLDGFTFLCSVGLQETDPVLLTFSHFFHKELIANNSPGITAIDIMMNCMQLEDIANEISILCKKTYTS